MCRLFPQIVVWCCSVKLCTSLMWLPACWVWVISDHVCASMEQRALVYCKRTFNVCTQTITDSDPVHTTCKLHLLFQLKQHMQNRLCLYVKQCMEFTFLDMSGFKFQGFCTRLRITDNLGSFAVKVLVVYCIINLERQRLFPIFIAPCRHSFRHDSVQVTMSMEWPNTCVQVHSQHCYSVKRLLIFNVQESWRRMCYGMNKLC